MNKLVLMSVAFFTGLVANAHSSVPVAANSATYYTGQQEIGLVGDTKECFVEAAFSPKGSKVEVRALIADPHDGELIGLGVVKANYDRAALSYIFQTSDMDAPIGEMILTASKVKNAELMSITFVDGGHSDQVTCGNLKIAENAVLVTTQDMFAHFSDYVEEEAEHEHEH